MKDGDGTKLALSGTTATKRIRRSAGTDGYDDRGMGSAASYSLPYSSDVSIIAQ
jgi:hypothetical protein